jgi:hypothetical protein
MSSTSGVCDLPRIVDLDACLANWRRSPNRWLDVGVVTHRALALIREVALAA